MTIPIVLGYCQTNTKSSLNCRIILATASLRQDTTHTTCQQEQHVNQQNKETLRPSPGRRGGCTTHQPPPSLLDTMNLPRLRDPRMMIRTRAPKTGTSWMPQKLWCKQRLAMTQNLTQIAIQTATTNLQKATTVRQGNSTDEKPTMSLRATSGTSLHNQTGQDCHPANGTCLI